MTTIESPPRAQTGSPVPVCTIDRVDRERGVAALVHERQVALFRLLDGTFRAVDHRDPATGQNVLARGLLGTVTTDGTLEWFVASPLHKHRYSLTDGRCLHDDHLRVQVHTVDVIDDVIHVTLGGAA